MNKLAFVMLLLVLAGCETYNVKMTDEQLENVKKIGVISVVGSDISYNYVGATVFGNKNEIYDFQELSFDNYILREMQSELSTANNKVEIVSIPVDGSVLSGSYNKPESLSGFELGKFLENVEKVSSNHNLSHILVVRRDSIQFDDAPVAINGIGLRKRINKNKIGAFIFIKFQLIDVLTKKEVSNTFILKKKKDSEFPWIQPFEKNTKETKLRLMSYFHNSISESSMRIARMLVSSSREFKVCSDQVFSGGFKIHDKTYYTREDVTDVISKFVYKKIVKEKVDPEDANPSYIGRFNEFDRRISECLLNI